MSGYTEISLVILNFCYLFRTISQFKATKLLLQRYFCSSVFSELSSLLTNYSTTGRGRDRQISSLTDLAQKGIPPSAIYWLIHGECTAAPKISVKNHDSIFLIIEKKPHKHDEVRKSKHLGLSCADLNRFLFFGMIVCKLTTWLVTIFDVYILAQQALKSPIICMWSQTSWSYCITRYQRLSQFKVKMSNQFKKKKK